MYAVGEVLPCAAEPGDAPIEELRRQALSVTTYFQVVSVLLLIKYVVFKGQETDEVHFSADAFQKRWRATPSQRMDCIHVSV